ncbi:MAG: ABC transporter substrate-binding protein [Methylococcus sp.]
MKLIAQWPRAILALASLPMIVGCGVDYDATATSRQTEAANNPDHIKIIVIDEPWAKTYLQGIRLAESQINARLSQEASSPPNTPLRQKQVKVLVKSGGQDYDSSHGTILSVAKDLGATAVLGHFPPDIAIPASLVYEASHLVFMPPFTGAQDLTSHGFKFVFQMVPDTAVMADQTANVAHLLGHKTLVLLYGQDEASRETAFLFEDAAIKQGMDFVHRRSFAAEETDYRELITQFSSKPFDMVYISSDSGSGALMIKQLREMGVHVPIFGGSSLAGAKFAEDVGKAGDNVIVPIVYNQEARTRINQTFRNDYHAMFDEWPDQAAAQGFDSLNLLASAYASTESAVPALISSTLHFMPYWTGVTGVHSFTPDGVVVGKKYFFQVFRDGNWHFLPAVHVPYFLDRFDRELNAQSPRPPGARSFIDQFSVNLDPEDLRIVQLDFLQNILKFHDLGVVYGETKPGLIPDRVSRIQALGRRRGFNIHGCGVATTSLERKALEQRLRDCYGELSIAVDALIVVDMPYVDPNLVSRVQRPLKYYKIPILSLYGDKSVSEFTAIRVDRLGDRQNFFGDKQGEQADETMISGILHETRMYELKERLANLPILDVNLETLKEYGFLHSRSLVGLAPDLYMEWLLASK